MLDSERNFDISAPVSPKEVSPNIFDSDSRVAKSKLFIATKFSYTSLYPNAGICGWFLA
jgi:hypothetical protein